MNLRNWLAVPNCCSCSCLAEGLFGLFGLGKSFWGAANTPGTSAVGVADAVVVEVAGAAAAAVVVDEYGQAVGSSWAAEVEEVAGAGNTAEEGVDGHKMTGGTVLLAQHVAGNIVAELERRFVDIAAVGVRSHWKLLWEAVGSLIGAACSHWS